MRTAMRMRCRLGGLLLVVAGLGGCEVAIDPSTGQSTSRLVLPFTEASANRAQQQWQDCIQFRSESYCERNLPQGRPPNTPSVGQPGLGRGLVEDDRTDP